MKAAVVNLSTIAKHKRWDVGYYLGNTEEAAEKLLQADVNLKAAQTRVETAKAKLQEEHDRARGFIDRGEVVPIRSESNGSQELHPTESGGPILDAGVADYQI